MKPILITAIIATLSLAAPVSAQNDSEEPAGDGATQGQPPKKVLNARQKNCLSAAETNLARRVCLATLAQRNCASTAANNRELRACF
jgi:hypothetical protein